MRQRDVEKAQLVGALSVICAGSFDRVFGVAQTLEVHTLENASVFDL